MGSVNSLSRKIDRLTALNNQWIYTESSLFIFIEKWLNHLVLDANVDLPGFTALRATRDAKVLWEMEMWGPDHFLLPIISVLIVVLNLLVIISISHFRQLHKANNFLLLSLAISDFLIGLVFFPGEMVKLTTCWFFGDLMCLLYSYILVLILCASVGNIVLVSVERYVAICYPLQYHRRITVTKIQVCISLCWFCSAVYSITFVKDGLSQISASCHGECVFFIPYSVLVLDLFLTFLLPISLIIFLYIRVFLVVVFQARAIRSHFTAPQQGPVTVRKSELKAARTIGFIVLVFVICFCPYYCAYLAGEISFNASTTVLCIFCINSCLNPMIYAMFYPWFRKAIKQIVTFSILQPGSSKADIL
ncbi:PREDICTED: trace amine-associated receptor 1-like [Cyprinodon variegatus]|uniref:trace amine-associated receptor 1-like n=1 Tax=Cyprinodon variegatus TaxID=28743 RepID=UPI000742AFDA|nr:PREDICTED: trace amine-associated receptor 1-like [Cyprinodon variegatus]